MYVMFSKRPIEIWFWPNVLQGSVLGRGNSDCPSANLLSTMWAPWRHQQRLWIKRVKGRGRHNKPCQDGAAHWTLRRTWARGQSYLPCIYWHVRWRKINGQRDVCFHEKFHDEQESLSKNAWKYKCKPYFHTYSSDMVAILLGPNASWPSWREMKIDCICAIFFFRLKQKKKMFLHV